MMENTNGYCRELIIHPGETLKEALDDKGMTQSELAVRTGFTAKHISKVINGCNDISPKMAKCLEYALGINASFWNNLQAEYARELTEFEEQNNISQDEIDILKRIKKILDYFIQQSIIKENSNKPLQVYELRQFLRVKNLTFIPKIPTLAAYRGSKTDKVDAYVLCAWQRLCELSTSNVSTSGVLDLDMLRESIPQIKALMFSDVSLLQEELTNIFSGCGIAFAIVKHFTGAPVQGFIEKNESGTIMLCMTIRQAYADIFWFTLFHEIAHILHGDVKKQFYDFYFKEDECEIIADRFARNTLIPDDKYYEFANKEDFSLQAINQFAKESNVKNYIVIGRLQKDEILDYVQYNEQKVRYKWK